MSQTKVVQKMETHILCSVNFFRKIVQFMRCGKMWWQKNARKNIPAPMHPRPRPPHTHKYVILLLFHGYNGFVNAPQCYVYMYIACLVQ